MNQAWSNFSPSSSMARYHGASGFDLVVRAGGQPLHHQLAGFVASERSVGFHFRDEKRRRLRGAGLSGDQHVGSLGAGARAGAAVNDARHAVDRRAHRGGRELQIHLTRHVVPRRIALREQLRDDTAR